MKDEINWDQTLASVFVLDGEYTIEELYQAFAERFRRENEVDCGRHEYTAIPIRRKIVEIDT